MDKQRRTRGFTFIELLIVMLLVTFLIALLVPAVKRSRDQARQKHCRNNLKQFGLAMHNYHDTHLRFPPGWTQHHALPGRQPRYGWSAFVLPFMEQDPLYQQVFSTEQTAEPLKLFQTQLAVYRCPEDPTPAVNPSRGDFGTMNYSVNYGTTAPPRWLGNVLSENWPGQLPTLAKTNGMAHWNSNVRIADILDGTSNTFLMGERSVTGNAGIWMGVRGNDYETDQVTDCAPGHEINASEAGFSSQHAGGANFLFVDGTVRFISEQIPSGPGEKQMMPVYQRLSGRHEGLPVGDF